MRVLAFSEHFFPRVGGTVSYVHQTCHTLTQLGHDVHLLVPSEHEYNIDIDDYTYRVTGIGTSWPAKSDPSRQVRYQFCQQAYEFGLEQLKAGCVDIVHILFGLFLNESLNIDAYKAFGIPCITTVVNLPPQECSRSWRGDNTISFMKECLRLKAVAFKNRQRLRSYTYDAYIVMSHHVERVISHAFPQMNTEVIGLGYSQDLFVDVPMPLTRIPNPGKMLKILTVGGWVPHKRQHLIPEVAAELCESGLSFEWSVVGPSGRIPRYQKAVKDAICRYKVDEVVKVYDTVPFSELVNFYQSAHLYVQPSTEEGFCITALDAAAAGLPVIACPTGALPEIAPQSGGLITQSSVDDLAYAIRHFVAARLWKNNVTDDMKTVRDNFSWEQSAKRLQSIYFGLLEKT